MIKVTKNERHWTISAVVDLGGLEYLYSKIGAELLESDPNWGKRTQADLEAEVGKSEYNSKFEE